MILKPATTLSAYTQDRLAQGSLTFTRDQAVAELSLTPGAFLDAAYSGETAVMSGGGAMCGDLLAEHFDSYEPDRQKALRDNFEVELARRDQEYIGEIKKRIDYEKRQAITKAPEESVKSQAEQQLDIYSNLEDRMKIFCEKDKIRIAADTSTHCDVLDYLYDTSSENVKLAAMNNPRFQQKGL